jgi:hypothetical protein
MTLAQNEIDRSQRGCYQFDVKLLATRPIATLGVASDPFGNGLTFSSGKRAECPP